MRTSNCLIIFKRLGKNCIFLNKIATNVNKKYKKIDFTETTSNSFLFFVQFEDC